MSELEEVQSIQEPIAVPAVDQTVLDAIVNRIFVIEAITAGHGSNPAESRRFSSNQEPTANQKRAVWMGPGMKDFLVRYQGHLRSEDSIALYEQISKALSPYHMTPLFRKENGQQVIYLVAGRINPKASNPWINLLMFALTMISVTFVGGIDSALSGQPASTLAFVWAVFINGIPFALALMAILVAHEFGHYLVGRAHGVHVSLPYFIPFPLPPFGTMGAFINMKEPPKNRRYLLDIGLAGPIAGVIVAIPVILLGLKLSSLEAIPLHLPQGMILSLEGNSILYLLMKFLVFGKWLPAPLNYGAVPAGLYWLKFFFTGQPYPWGGLDVIIHPIALAGWGGLLVTSLNLIPAGQFDGGHAMYVLFGRKVMQLMLPFILVAIVILGFFWPGWWLWAALIFFLGRVYAEPLDQITELDPKRRALAIFGIILFFLVFTPVPMSIISS